MTKQQDFKKVRLFKLSRDFNVTVDTIVDHLKSVGMDGAMKGSGLNAAVTEEEAFLELRRHFADDMAAAARLKEKRAEARAADDDAKEDAVTRIEHEAEVHPGVAEETEPEEPVEAPEVAEPVAEEAAVEEADDDEPVVEDVLAETDDTPEAVEEDPQVVEAEAEEAVTAEADELADAEAEQPIAEVEPEAVVDEVVEPIAEDEVDVPVAEEILAATDEPVSETEEPAEEAELDVTDVEAVAEVDEQGVETPDSVLKANRHQLQGTKVLGKIDLSKLDADSDKKRKRKRKRKTTAAEPETKAVKPVEVSAETKKKKKKKRGPAVDDQAVEQSLQDTLRELEQGASRARQRRRRQRRDRRAETLAHDRQAQADADRVLRVTEFVSTGELANLMDVGVNEIIKTLFESGLIVSINQRLDADTISFVADEFGIDVEFIADVTAEDIVLVEDDPADLQPRPPIVTVMGHVDHGKTSLLDYIRSATVVAGEAGGITQHIGAYKVEMADRGEITFLDTPGHEAFTAMRARGAKVTDVVILVVAADDSVMPQTIEAINHAKAGDVPIIVAINKIDKPTANPQKVMQQLADHNVLVEQYGGKVQCSLVSAHTGEGIDDLLDKVLLEAELKELSANPNRNANGFVIESRLEKGRGNVATVLIQTGTLRVGDVFVAGIHSGRVRAMFDERDNRIESVGPSEPAMILGFMGAAEVGDQFVVLDEEKEARDIAQRRQQIHREQALRQKKHITLDEIGRRLALGDFRELNLILKADVGGSVEALADSLLKLSTEEVALNIIHSGVGGITESDIMLASASDAVIIGFQVRPTAGARHLADREEIDVRTYSVIYDAIEDVHDALEGLLSPEKKEVTVGMAEIRETFRVPRAGTVAGCYVIDGKIRRNDRIRVIRDGVVVYEGNISSLKRFKDDVREVQSGYECGISVENFNDLKVGDQFETFEIIEEKRKLEV